MFHIVLVEPEIPQNAGNIARTCAATGTHLHMIRPLGFEVTDKYLKRAGLDYWHQLDITYYENIEDFYERNPDSAVFYYTTKAPRKHTDVSYPKKVYLMFGKETKGLPEELLRKNADACVRIPMRNTLRSLNLSNAVAIAVYEAFRQRDFEGLKEEGTPTTFSWE